MIAHWLRALPDSAVLTAIAAGLALAFGLLLMPLVTALGHRFQLLDQPDLVRRLHRVARPRLGGVALIAAVTATGLILNAIIARHQTGLQLFGPVGPALFLAIGILFVVGVWDDLRGIPPVAKILGQLLAAFLLVRTGLVVDQIALTTHGPVLDLGVWAVPVTMLWLVGIPNAVNLIDGLDGLAAYCGTITILTLLTAGAWLAPGHPLLLAAAALGALGAFARANWHPARLFLGDSGSLTLGLFLGTFAITAATDPRGVTYPVIALVALGYPLLDTGVAMLRRWLRGAPISRADGRHVHHQLLAIGFRQDDAVRLIALGSLVLAALGLSLTLASSGVTLVLMIGTGSLIVVLLVSGVRWLGYGEFTAVGISILGGLARARRVIRERIRLDEVASRIPACDDRKALRRVIEALADGRTIAYAAILPPEAPVTLRQDGGEALTLVAQPIIPPRSDRPHATLALWLTAAGLTERTGGRTMEILHPVLRQWFATRPADPARIAAPVSATMVARTTTTT